MKKIKFSLFAILCLLLGTSEIMAQVDVTALYLSNADFDSNYDYDAKATGNVAQEMLPVEGWINDYTMNYTIVGTYQVGTKKTFNGASVPTANVEGTAEGGVLALSTGWEESLKLYQEVTLPKGEYALVTAYYNGCSSTGATSLVGWIPSSGTSTMSKVNKFAANKWVTDTLTFKLLIGKEGKIQIGMKAVAGGSANSAKLSFDYVKLFSYNWDGSLLTDAIEKATKLYGDGTTNGAKELKSILDAASAVQNNTEATADEQVEATAALNKAINVYQTLQEAYKDLQKAIDSAVEQLGDDTGYGSAELKEAIDKASQAVADTEATPEELNAAMEELNQAINVYKAIAVAHENLQKTIEDATTLFGEGTGEGASTLHEAIEKAKQIAASTGVTPDDIKAATAELKEAIFAYNIANATGTAPTVTTHHYVARGSTVALGRSTVSGSDLLEQGFCWSTNPEPTVLDNRSTKSYSQNGRIYAMEGLEPSTIYYVRAYALTKNYAVGYGEVKKVITLPKGKVKWTYDYGADDAANARIAAAVEDAVNYMNTYTSINGLTTQVHYGSGTPTADCSYGGWMRVGPNASYQRTGTILHELGHAIGVGTHSIWNGSSSPLRSGSGRGDWLGDRATEVVRFLNNDKTSVMTGDNTHMWPYGINGAHEDNGKPILYICNTLIYQAIGEDGLPPTGGFCTPAYSFEQEDTIKYYIKNENTDRGLYTAYLKQNAKGHLVWEEMTAENALDNDSAAWYITFNPENCYYQLRNAATGHYISYSGTGNNGIRTASKTQVGSNENFHVMRSRVDLTLGSDDNNMTTRGYWLIHPEHKTNPTCLVASTKGGTSTAAFNLNNSATVQRWLILTADEVNKFNTASADSFKEKLNEILTRIKALVAVPHTEDVEGTDASINATIATLEAKSAESLTSVEIASLVTEAESALFDFLANATPTSTEQPFDLTYMITNAAIDDASGWSMSPTFNYSCLEFYQATFDFNQTIQNLPAGTYQVKMQGFQRPGSSANSYDAYVSGKNNVTTVLYANSTTEKIKHIATEAQTKKLGGAESTVGSSPTMYMPNDMNAASIYFDKGLYENTVTAELKTDKTNLKIGLRCSSSNDYYWTIFDNFRLYYFGAMEKDVVNDIDEVMLPTDSSVFDIYSITGVRVRSAATTLEGLPAGMYIIGGRKVLVK